MEERFFSKSFYFLSEIRRKMVGYLEEREKECWKLKVTSRKKSRTVEGKDQRKKAIINSTNIYL